MSKSAFIVRDGDASHRTLIGGRDIVLLFGPLFIEGFLFSSRFGFYENFSVAGGIPDGSHVIRPGDKLFSAAYALQHAIERDIELLQFDYSFSIGNNRPRKGPQSIMLRGRNGIVAAHPKGFCFAKLLVPGRPGWTAELIDLRIVQDLVTDDSLPIKVHRKAATVNWPEVLPPLLEFLRPRVKKRLTVEHIDRAE
jgi:hypothetical protein